MIPLINFFLLKYKTNICVSWNIRKVSILKPKGTEIRILNFLLAKT